MSDTVIKVENLSKKYILSHQSQERYTVLRDVMANGVKRLGQRLFSPKSSNLKPDTEEEFYALRDVSFDIKQGDRVGIIGRNGAGKSTLLKILSRITEPTSGKIEITGRVASLLEVGTGFHPELTGRENIFLNGAILGMGKAEIKRKFDEIVAFAEVEKFLDTPVKRYSSGMYVRLAFAVAAHLEPEILIVDEVLAVGDAQFQKKCLGKMEEVGKEGRTVIFVSHNMGAVNALCSAGILLQKGEVACIGETRRVVAQYLDYGLEKTGEKHWAGGGVGDDSIRLIAARLFQPDNTIGSNFGMQEEIVVEIEYAVFKKIEGARVGFRLLTAEGIIVLTSENTDECNDHILIPPGNYRVRATIPGNYLNEGDYSLTISCHIPLVKIIFFEENCLSLLVENTGGVGGFVDDKRQGIIRPRLEWKYEYTS
jgi:lipopolysaccharide transport system ATP-binding protein